jgi:hypothetical protein
MLSPAWSSNAKGRLSAIARRASPTSPKLLIGDLLQNQINSLGTSVSADLMGALEQACATGSEAATLIRRLDSNRIQVRLAEFRTTLTPFRTSAAVREFDDKHGDLIAAISS